ncbi:MAG: hypothetical protein KF710_04815 [Rhodocyclaceae bacterium]|nr:hypothetical protein [Rhodocyclaceae bacterium]
MRKKLLGFGGVIAALGIVVFGINFVTLQKPMSGILDDDPRNNGISVFAHYGMLVDLNELVFDLRGVSGENSAADVSRVLLQYAEALKNKQFGTVILSYKGERKFLLTGKFFHTLGTEYETQNPVYTMRTFPENVYELDGTSAFGTWTGGWLGVVGKQMEDFNEFHKRWYLSAAVGSN